MDTAEPEGTGLWFGPEADGSEADGPEAEGHEAEGSEVDSPETEGHEVDLTIAVEPDARVGAACPV